MATTNLLHRITDEWSKRVESFNSKITNGCRRIHNLLFSGDEQSATMTGQADNVVFFVETKSGLQNPYVVNGKRAIRHDEVTGAEIVWKSKVDNFYSTSKKLTYFSVSGDHNQRVFRGHELSWFKYTGENRMELRKHLDDTFVITKLL